MARPLRIHPPGGFHHITARGNARQAIFLDDDDRVTFIRLLADLRIRFGCEVHAYCLMDNHIHLLIRDLAGDLSRALRHLNGVYAQRFNRRHDRVGHVFQARFANSLLGDDAYLVNAFVYVHRNPVEAGLVADPIDYPWSSMRQYAGLERRQGFLQTGSMLDLYGSRPALVEAARRPVANELAEQLSAFLRAPVLGSDEFCQGVVEAMPRCSETEASARRVLVDPERRPLPIVAASVAASFGVDPMTLRCAARGRRNDARSMASALARREGWTLAAIADYFGFASGNAVSAACGRFEQRLEREPDLWKRWLSLVANMVDGGT